ncbi:MAG: hypothetical protein WBE82_05440, partial [Xanthobacteraceae bacterium]
MIAAANAPSAAIAVAWPGRSSSRAVRAVSPQSKWAKPLTLAAMSLGYGVVQLDVTIVNTALNSIGSALGGG